jgi:hypothetical protein
MKHIPSPGKQAPVFISAGPKKTDAVHMERYPNEEGQLKTIVLQRISPHDSFGFGVASVWQLDGSINVVSFVDNTSGAAVSLVLQDQVVRVNGQVRSGFQIIFGFSKRNW